MKNLNSNTEKSHNQVVPVSQAEHHKVLVLHGHVAGGACGTKLLIIDKNGNKQKRGARHQSLFYPSQFECNDIKSLAAGIHNLEDQPNKFIIHGQPVAPITGQRINRRKHETKGKAKPSIMPHASVPFFTVDIDNLPLARLGYDDKSVITDAAIEPLVGRITEQFLTDFIGVSYYAQFSASCGWKDDAQKTVKIHIWWWLDHARDLGDIKTYAKQINASAGFTLLDTAIYQAVQPLYIAAPIFPNVLQPDHMSERSKLVILDQASASLGDVDLPRFENVPRRVRKSNRTDKLKSQARAITPTPTTFQGWIDFFKKLPVAESIHETLGIFFAWAIREGVMAKTQLNKDLSDEQVQDIVAFLNGLTGEFSEQTMPRLPGLLGNSVIFE